MTKVIYGESTSGYNGENNLPDELFTQISKKVEDGISNTGEWSTKQDKYHKIRMRIKKEKKFPFIGASNIRMPTAETYIRKIKSSIMGVLFGIRPIVQVVPSPSSTLEGALKIEKFLDHLAMDVMRIEPEVEISVDQSLEKGFTLIKPHWRRDVIDRTEKVDMRKFAQDEIDFVLNFPKDLVIPEIIKRFDVDMHPSVADLNIAAIEAAVDSVREGKDKVNITVKDLIYNAPALSLVSPERCYVPTESGFDVQKNQCITHEFFMPLHEVKRRAEFNGWSKEAVSKLKWFKSKELTSDKQSDTAKDTREGITRLQSNSQLVKVWETYGWFDIDGDGTPQKSVITSFPDFKLIARKVLISSPSGKYPFVKFFYELTDDRWFSHRGICEMAEDIIKEIDVQHNMKIDGQTIRNAPMFIHRAGMIDPTMVTMRPNQSIPVNGLQPLDDTIKVLNLHNPNTEYSYEREAQILETKLQEMFGQVDFGLQSQINRRQPRTLGEVEAQNQAAARTFSLDSSHYTFAFTELLNMIYELWIQYGDDDYEFKYFGESQQGETIKITKEELQGKYTITVRGNDNNTNPQIKLQKAQQILAAVTNPILLQTGIVTPQNIANGVRRFFQIMEIENFEQFINVKPQPQQQDPRMAIQPKFEDLKTREKAQILQAHGIKPDLVKRGDDENIEALINATEAYNAIGDN